MKKNTNKQLAQALFIATHNVHGSDLEKIIKKFVVLLARERKLKQANKIITEFYKHAKKQEGIVDIEITTARQTSNAMIEKIKDIFGKKVEADSKIDNALLGGLIIKTEDTIFDASLKTQINRLKLSISG